MQVSGRSSHSQRSGSWLLILTAALILALGSQANTQDARPLYPVRWNAKYGYIDKTGKVVILHPFDTALPFSEELAAVRTGDPWVGKWGYIDKAGRVAISPQFDLAEPFSEGLAVVNIGMRVGMGAGSSGKYGYI